jgi:hypothetical protein
MVDMAMPPIELRRTFGVAARAGLPLRRRRVPRLVGVAGKRAEVERGAGDRATNPLQLALVFPALFLVVSLATAWVQSVFGQRRIFALAALFGASDIDPFVLGFSQRAAEDEPLGGSRAVLIAASANNLAKAGYPIGLGGFTAAQRTDGNDPGDPHATWPRGSSRLPRVSGVASIPKKGAQ